MSNPQPPVVDPSKTIPEMVDFFLTHFTTITKAESDYIEGVIHWTQEIKAAFCMAKRIFEEANIPDLHDALAEKSEVS